MRFGEAYWLKPCRPFRLATSRRKGHHTRVAMGGDNSAPNIGLVKDYPLGVVWEGGGSTLVPFIPVKTGIQSNQQNDYTDNLDSGFRRNERG